MDTTSDFEVSGVAQNITTSKKVLVVIDDLNQTIDLYVHVDLSRSRSTSAICRYADRH